MIATLAAWSLLACHRPATGDGPVTDRPTDSGAPDTASVTSAAETGTTPTGDTSDSGTASVDVEVPYPRRCENPAGLDTHLIGDAASEVSRTEMVGYLALKVSEPDPGMHTWLSPYLTTWFTAFDSFTDLSTVADPYQGLDDCIIFAPYDFDQSGFDQSAGRVTYDLAGRQETVDPWWGWYEYLYGLWYNPLMFYDLDPPIAVEDLWGQPLSVTAEGADLPAFSIPDAVTFPAGPLDITSPLPRTEVDKDDLRLRWTGSGPGSLPLFVSLSFAGNNGVGEANAIHCYVEDDGDWTPPAEVWSWVSEPYPVGMSITVLRQDVCAWEIAPRQFVQVSAVLDCGYSLTLTDEP